MTIEVSTFTIGHRTGDRLRLVIKGGIGMGQAERVQGEGRNPIYVES